MTASNHPAQALQRAQLRQRQGTTGCELRPRPAVRACQDERAGWAHVLGRQGGQLPGLGHARGSAALQARKLHRLHSRGSTQEGPASKGLLVAQGSCSPKS